ncbi:MAG: hypothetical protein EAY81_11280 [Bacteroidetes bacterium]|nr:MAG: hypothetical protein EAY81_11280 [Bacteroidota bacterium]
MQEINKDYIAIGVLTAGILYLAIMYVLQRLKSAQHQKAIMAAKDAYDNVKNSQREEKEKIIESIIAVYGYESGKKVRNGEVWVGMPMHLLLLAKGKANSIKQSVDTNAITQTWVYNSGDDSRKGAKADIEVVIQNNQVQSWKQAV